VAEVLGGSARMKGSDGEFTSQIFYESTNSRVTRVTLDNLTSKPLYIMFSLSSSPNSPAFEFTVQPGQQIDQTVAGALNMNNIQRRIRAL
jgi:hypothetical protein